MVNDYLCNKCINNLGKDCTWGDNKYPYAYDKCNNYHLSVRTVIIDANKIMNGGKMKRKHVIVKKEEKEEIPNENWEVRNTKDEITYLAYLPNKLEESPYAT